MSYYMRACVRACVRARVCVCVLLHYAVAVQHLESKEVDEEEFLSLSTDKITLEILRCVFAGILACVRLALRAPSSLKSDVGEVGAGIHLGQGQQTSHVVITGCRSPTM